MAAVARDEDAAATTPTNRGAGSGPSSLPAWMRPTEYGTATDGLGSLGEDWKQEVTLRWAEKLEGVWVQAAQPLLTVPPTLANTGLST